MSNYKKFCIHPFNQIVTRSHGSLSPCCHDVGDKNLNEMTLSEYWNGHFMSNLRQQMLDGADINDCNRCYDNERQNGNSQRLCGLHKFNINESTDLRQRVKEWEGIEFPARLEVHMGNLCNLKCLTCNPDDSSAIRAENLKLGITNSVNDFVIDSDTIDGIITNLNSGKIKHIDFRGGESLLLPEIRKIMHQLNDDVYQNVTLSLQTNTTYISDEWKRIISRFQQVIVSSSIDAISEQLTYIRYPANWGEVQDNLFWYKEQLNVRYHVAITVTNLNLLCLDQLIYWLTDKNVEFWLNPTINPEIFRSENLPNQLLQVAKKRLAPLVNLTQSNKVNSAVLQHLLALEPANNNELWKKFCQEINMRDAHRGNRIFNVMPEFDEHWA